MAQRTDARFTQRTWGDKRQPIALLLGFLRRVRTEREMLATLFVLVALSSFVFSAIPLLFNTMSDDGLAHAVRTTSPFQRNILMSLETRIDPATDGQYVNVDREGAEFQDELAPSIQSIIERRTFTVDTVRYRVVELSGTAMFPFPRYITLRHQSEIDPHIRLVAGRMPNITDEIVVTQRTVAGASTESQAHVYETVVSTETARQLGVHVGDRLMMEPYADDQLVRLVPRRDQSFIALDIVGLIDINEPDAEFWFGDQQVHRASEFDDGNTVHIYATGLMAPDAYATLYESARFSFRYGWRYFVDPDSLDAGSLGQLSTDVRRLDADYGMSIFARPGERAVRTGLSSVFTRFESQRNLTEAILSLSSIGLLAVSLAVTALMGVLLSERRRDATVLVRGRGGSAAQILGSQTVETLVYSVPAALIGFGAAVLIVGGRITFWPVLAAIGIAATATALLVIASAPLARRSLGAIERDDPTLRRTSVRRIVLDVSIIVLALLGVYLLRRRGLTGASSVARMNEFDPYMAAVPVLLGLAVGLVVIRFYVLPVRLFAWLSSLRRDLVPVLGFRRVSRHPGSTSLPLLVLLLSLAVAVFSSVLLFTISEGQINTSWQRVGADYRVSPSGTGFLYRGIDLSGVGEIETIAPAYLVNDAQVVASSPTFGTTQMLAPDIAALTRVNDGTRAQPNFPDAMTQEPTPGIGSASIPIPVVASDVVGGRMLRRGDTFMLNLLGQQTAFVVEETRDRFPGVDASRSFVIASRDHLQAAYPTRTLGTSTLFIRAPEGAHIRIDETIASQSQGTTLTSRSADFRAVHDAPLIAGVQGGYRVGLIVTALYAGLAIIIALTLTARERARDLAFLRTLGLTPQQAVGLTATELLPPVVLAMASGVALGIAVARLIEPGLDLAAFTGPGMPIELQVNWVTVTLLVIGLAVVVCGAVVVTTAVVRRASLGQMLRVGD